MSAGDADGFLAELNDLFHGVYDNDYDVSHTPKSPSANEHPPTPNELESMFARIDDPSNVLFDAFTRVDDSQQTPISPPRSSEGATDFSEEVTHSPHRSERTIDIDSGTGEDENENPVTRLRRSKVTARSRMASAGDGDELPDDSVPSPLAATRRNIATSLRERREQLEEVVYGPNSIGKSILENDLMRLPLEFWRDSDFAAGIPPFRPPFREVWHST